MRLLTENAVNAESSDGGAAIGGDFSAHAERYRREPLAHCYRMTGSLVANGQPAAAMYVRAGDVHLPFQLHVLDTVGGRVSHVVAFLDGTLFGKFGLPGSL